MGESSLWNLILIMVLILNKGLAVANSGEIELLIQAHCGRLQLLLTRMKSACLILDISQEFSLMLSRLLPCQLAWLQLIMSVVR